MDDVTIEKECNCPMECDSIGYAFTIVSTPFDPEEMCPSNFKNSKSESKSFLMKEFYSNLSPPQFMRKLNELTTNASSNVGDICKRNLEYRAQVIFRLAANTLPLTIMSRRKSPFDKLSDFGKL